MQTIERTTFLEALKIAETSLDEKSMIPIMRHFWFTGTHIVTYDDRTAVSMPFESGFKGAVPDVLISIIKNSTASQVKIGDPADGFLPVQLGKTTAKFPFLPDSSFIFDMPQAKLGAASDDDKAKKAEKALVAALAECLLCVDEESSRIDCMGVTFDPEKNAVYSTNSFVFCKVKVPFDDLEMAKAPDKRVILSASFCRQLVALGKEHRYRIRFNRDGVIVRTASKVSLFGRLLATDDPLNFEKVITEVAPNFNDALIELPGEKYDLVVARANIIAEDRTNPAKTSVTISNGLADFETKKNDRGMVRDALALEGHANTSIVLDPKWLKRIGTDVSAIRFNERCVQLKRGAAHFLVSALIKNRKVEKKRGSYNVERPR